MKKLLFIFLSLASLSFANETYGSFHHKSVGVSIIKPTIFLGMGHRNTFKDFALDSSIDFTINSVFTEVLISYKYLQYIGQKDYYIGAGIYTGGITNFHAKEWAYGIGPVISFGKEEKKIFQEVNLHITNVCNNRFAFMIGTFYKFGFKF